jgi:hypothetical protein
MASFGTGAEIVLVNLIYINSSSAPRIRRALPMESDEIESGPSACVVPVVPKQMPAAITKA